MVRRQRVAHVIRVKESLWGRIYSAFNYVFVTLIALLMLYPMLNVLAVSLSEYSEYLKAPWMVFPRNVTLDGYKFVFNYSGFWRSYAITILVTALGTALGLIITILTSYPLSRPQFKGKTIIMLMIIFIMVFSAGLVPSYLNMKELGLVNNLFAIIIPSCFTPFNCILMINFMKEIPGDLIDAAMVDGASEPYILFKIIVPLSRAVMASITLFLAVGYWNSYFSAQVYLRDRELWPLALVLKELLLEASTLMAEAGMDPAVLDAFDNLQTVTIRYASIIVSVVPILCVYPFLQKYFAKGVMVGGVKG